MANRKALFYITRIEEYPWQALEAGVKAAGFWPTNDQDADILVTWSPWNHSARQALQQIFEHSGRPVIIVENGWLSPIRAVPYFQIALGGWNGTGHFPAAPGRWESWRLSSELLPWRRDRRGHALVIGQRGHPTDPRTCAPDWEKMVRVPTDLPVVLRRARNAATPLLTDLRNAAECHVWTSNVASQAVCMGIPVIQHGPNLMVSELASRPGEPLRFPDRIPVLDRLAGAQWTSKEIATGHPFSNLLALCA